MTGLHSDSYQRKILLSASELTTPDAASVKEATRPSVLICDPNPVLSHALRHLLEKEPHLAGYTFSTSVSPDLGSMRKSAPDILILDPLQDEANNGGIPDALSQVSAITSLIGYCSPIGTNDAHALRLSGFRAIVPRTVSGEELVRIVCIVAFGGTYLHPSYLQNEGATIDHTATHLSAPPALTEREFEVLRQVALGSSMKEIAAVLNISTKTVDTYKARASHKLELNSRSDIVRYAIQSGWMHGK